MCLYIALYDFIWPQMTLYGFYGFILLYMALYGLIWTSLASYGPLLSSVNASVQNTDSVNIGSIA